MNSDPFYQKLFTDGYQMHIFDEFERVLFNKNPSFSEQVQNPALNSLLEPVRNISQQSHLPAATQSYFENFTYEPVKYQLQLEFAQDACKHHCRSAPNIMMAPTTHSSQRLLDI